MPTILNNSFLRNSDKVCLTGKYIDFQIPKEVAVKTEDLASEDVLSSEKGGNAAQDELKKGDCENENPSLPEAAKKNKKKKKKAAAVNSGENGKEAEVITDQVGEGKKILGEINLNKEESTTEVK